MSTLRKISFTLVFLFVNLGLLFFFLPKPALLNGMSFSTAVYDQHHRLLRLTLSNDDKYRLFTPLSQISPDLIAGTLLQEDQYFWTHVGVNPLSLMKALWQTYIVKSRRVGASTITMQLARMRFGLNSKKMSGKWEQIFRALQLERYYSKQQILEAYLNLAPYGNNVEGVGAASLIYFNKPANALTLLEALTLSVIPQNPNKRMTNGFDRRCDRWVVNEGWQEWSIFQRAAVRALENSPPLTGPRDFDFCRNGGQGLTNRTALNASRQQLYARWVKSHPKDEEKAGLMQLPLAMRTIHDLPFSAPHWVNGVLSTQVTHPSKSSHVVTTLDSDLQTLLTRVTRRYVEQKKKWGVYNAAVLLVDVRDMGIKGMVGSVDFFNHTIGGQINGTEIKRSPGSTLKPFIYGLAFDQGLIHPGTVLKDVPHQFGAYNPENFDYDFMGPIKARDALILSRNIPAIYLANQLKPSLYQLIEAAQITHLKAEGYYGLTLSLGGAELTMKELTSLYAMLVNEGQWRPLRVRESDPLVQGKQLLSREASFLVLDILKDVPRPEHGMITSQFNTPVAWKTGTSSGYRDAWSIGSFGPYVLAVWIGDFNNQGNPAFIGKSMAAPLFFELIEAIEHEKGPLPPVARKGGPLLLKQIPVCKASGMLPTRYCLETELSWFIPGKSPIKTDTIFREVAINKKSGLRTCHIDDDTRFEIYEFWSTDLLKIFKQAGLQRPTPPAFEPDCQHPTDGIKPQISSPQTAFSYVLPLRANQNRLIPFTAVTDADVKTIYWFINDAFLSKTSPNKPYLWQAKPGKYIVRVVDDHGQSDARDVVIRQE